MNITLVISSMSGGGAERVMSILANEWVKRDREITLITIAGIDRDFYELDSRVNRVALDLEGTSKNILAAVRNNLDRIRLLRRAIVRSSPDVVISFIDGTNVLTLLASVGGSWPVIVSEHIDPRQMPPPKYWRGLRRRTYQRADCVVVLTQELRTVVSEFVANEVVRVIPNPAISIDVQPDSISPIELPDQFIAAMGRLHYQKGFDYLIEAYRRCASIEACLVILGEGPMRQALERQVSEAGLQEKVFLPGAISMPEIVLSKSMLFVLSSRFEGFPMALVEAMCCGLPVLSFDCPTGPNEIVQNGVNGRLVPAGDVQALSNAIRELICDEGQRRMFGSNARSVIERYSLRSVMDKWENTIEHVRTRRCMRTDTNWEPKQR